MYHIENYRTRWHDTDADRILRPSQLMVYLQETANLQFVTHKRDLDKERDEVGTAFILSRICLDIHAPLFAYEDIEVETFTCDSRGFSFNRCFRILRGGEVIAEALTVWALINIKTGKLLRAEEYDVGFENEPILSVNAPVRIKMPPQDAFCEVGKRTIVYSDIDYNMHMNNTRYPNMLCDFMDAADTSRISGISLSYLREAALGDTLKVMRAKLDDRYFFRTVGNDGKVCLEAEVILK